MASAQIKELQRRLGELGPSVTVDGDFGPVTLESTLDLLDELKALRDTYEPGPVKPSTTNPFSVEDNLLLKHNDLVTQKPSPNYSGPITPQIIVQHYTGDNSASGAISWLCSPESGVSAHLVIAKDGTVTQLVPFNRRAWHAGVSSWNGEAMGNSVNGFSIGIENVGVGDSWPDAQVETIKLVTQALVLAYDLEDVVGHSDVSPGRKTDPGDRFPWNIVWPNHG